ncbi:MAG: GerMN domain-containing protein [Armatimonadota bacterium]
MPRSVRREVCALAAGLLLCALPSGCSWRQKPASPGPGPGPTPRTIAPGDEDSISLTAYFADPSAAALAPVKRTVRPEPEAAARDAMQALVEGPMPDEGLHAVMPDGAALEQVRLDGAVARVRMNQAFYDNFPHGGAFGNLCVYAIVNTLTGIPGIDEVVIEVPDGGKLLGELDVSEPLQRDDELVAAK